MSLFHLRNLYRLSDLQGLSNLEQGRTTGSFTLNSTAQKLTATVRDDDNLLQDNQASLSLGETYDNSQQQLNSSFDNHASGVAVRSTDTIQTHVIQPDGVSYSLEMSRIVIDGSTYYEFKHDVPAGSKINVESWKTAGDAKYADLEGGHAIHQNVYNQVVLNSVAAQVINGGKVWVGAGTISEMHVNDQDTILAGNTDGGTADYNIQPISARSVRAGISSEPITQGNIRSS